MNKRGAIELSMNTIVVVVIAIVLLSLGLVFVRKIMGEVTETSGTAFDAADKAIQELMGGDQQFFIQSTTKEIGVGKTETINAGIQNFLGKNMKFKIEVSSADGESDVSWINAVSSRTVLAGGKGGFPIVINVPNTAVAGSTSMYEISVYDEEDSLYGSEILAINVK